MLDILVNTLVRQSHQQLSIILQVPLTRVALANNFLAVQEHQWRVANHQCHGPIHSECGSRQYFIGVQNIKDIDFENDAQVTQYARVGDHGQHSALECFHFVNAAVSRDSSSRLTHLRHHGVRFVIR